MEEVTDEMESKLQQQTPQEKKSSAPNLTGIPTQMKLDFERRSGLSFDDVRVHYNSEKPAQLQALAYAQDAHIYVAPGQEQYLGHELGHIVQQKYGMVFPTSYINGIPISTDTRLENMAERYIYSPSIPVKGNAISIQKKTGTVQRKIISKRVPPPYDVHSESPDAQQNIKNIENFLLFKAKTVGGLLRVDSRDQTPRIDRIKRLWKSDHKKWTECLPPSLHNLAVGLAVQVTQGKIFSGTDILKKIGQALKENDNSVFYSYSYSQLNQEKDADALMAPCDNLATRGPELTEFFDTAHAGYIEPSHTEPKILFNLFTKMKQIQNETKITRYDMYLYSERDACTQCTKAINAVSNLTWGKAGRPTIIRDLYFYWSFSPKQYISEKKAWLLNSDCDDVFHQPKQKDTKGVHISIPMPASSNLRNPASERKHNLADTNGIPPARRSIDPK